MSADTEPYVLFELVGSLYGIPSASIQHIELYDHVTLVPNANPAIEGVVFSRGQVIPALDLRTRFGFPRAEKSPRTRIIFAKVHDRTVGLVVDSAREFKRFPTQEIRPIEETLTGIDGKYLKALVKTGDRVVLILDLEAILNLEDVEVPASASTADAEEKVS